MGRLTIKDTFGVIDCVADVHDCYDCEQCYHFKKMLEKLCHYEDLEEQGRLIELPCAVGSCLYYIGNNNKVYFLNVATVEGALFFKDDEGNLKRGFYRTKEEAEAKLKELEGE